MFLRNLILFAFLFLQASPLFAYNKKFNVFTQKLDYVGVEASADVSVICPSGQVLLSSGGGTWACGSAGSGSTPTGTGFVHINAGNQDAAARAVNLASDDVTGTLAVGNGGTGATTLNNLITLGTMTTGSYVESLVSGNAILVLNQGVESATPTVSWDTITVSQDALSTTSVTPSGFQVINGRATLLQGCSDAQVLQWDETNDVWKCATVSGSASPGGSDTQVQFNNGGSFGGDAGLVYIASTDVLKVSGDVVGTSAAFGITIDGGGAAITTGSKGFIRLPYGMNIRRWTILADRSGSISLDVTKVTFSNFPTGFVSIDGTTIAPRLISEQASTDGTMAGWNASLASGDIVQVSVDSVATVQRVNVLFQGDKQ